MLVEIVFQLPVVILSPEASLIVPSLTLPFLCMAVHAFPSFFFTSLSLLSVHYLFIGIPSCPRDAIKQKEYKKRSEN